VVADGIIVGTDVKVGGTVVTVLSGLTPTVVEVGDGDPDWVAGANIGKLHANIKMTDTNNAMILKGRIILSF